MSLFWRVVVVNVIMVLVAVIVLIFSPITVSPDPTANEKEVIIGGGLFAIAIHMLLMRRAFDPLARLTATMRRVDPHAPGRRVAIARPAPEVAELAGAFNDMLDRLEAERRDSGRRALGAQEGERVRVARELHDQVGQTLTGVVLALEEIHRRAPVDLRVEVQEVQEAARAGVEHVRGIARGLRPGALEELGLRSALTTLANSFSGLRVRHSLRADLPPLSPEQDLAVYRVAQESLTNVARHAHAQTARLELGEHDGAVVLTVSDDGCGIADAHAAATAGGVGGMRERALLAGGRLQVRALPERGTEVRLDLWPSRS